MVASPSPSPSPSTTPSAPAPLTGIKVSLTFSGVGPTTFAATKSAQLAASLASLMGIPASWVSVAVAAPATRRLQAAGDATAITVTIPSSDPTAAAAKLQSAVSSGAVASMLSQLGLTLASNSVSVSSYGTAAPTPDSPSPSPATSPPASTPSANSSGSGSSNIGAIVGEKQGFPGG